MKQPSALTRMRTLRGRPCARTALGVHPLGGPRATIARASSRRRRSPTRSPGPPLMAATAEPSTKTHVGVRAALCAHSHAIRRTRTSGWAVPPLASATTCFRVSSDSVSQVVKGEFRFGCCATVSRLTPRFNRVDRAQGAAGPHGPGLACCPGRCPSPWARSAQAPLVSLAGRPCPNLPRVEAIPIVSWKGTFSAPRRAR
jgi:hypothetical protein